MRIVDLGAVEAADGRRRIEADVLFEDVDRPPLRLFFEAEAPLADALEARPEAFLAACWATAFWVGEKRVLVPAEVDRVFADGLAQAGRLLAAWYPPRRPPRLETEGGMALRPAPEPHVAALCSGGADALVLLAENRRLFPPDHPASVRTVVYLFGCTPQEFDPEGNPLPAHVAAFERQWARIREIARKVGAVPCRVWTNAPRVAKDAEPWLDAAHAAAYVAPLLAAPRLVTAIHLASSGAGPDSPPHGSHALLDPLHATAATDVHLAQPVLTRHAKLGLLADWEPAWDAVRVCHNYLVVGEGSVNCGACEKCVRTMTGLLAWGALDRFTAFPHDDVTPEMIRRVRIKGTLTYLPSRDLLEHLARIGREDLVEAILEIDRRRGETAWQRRKRKTARSLAKRFGGLGRLGRRRGRD